MIDLKMFVIYHDKSVLAGINGPHINKYALGDLDVGKYQVPSIAENRFLYYLASNPDLIDKEYVGIGAGSWRKKYCEGHRPQTPSLESLRLLKPFRQELVFAADATRSLNWKHHSEVNHPGIGELIEEIYERNGFDSYGPTFWANNFVCHREVMLPFLQWWKGEFEHFFNKYGEQPPYTHNPAGRFKLWLHPAYFYERLTVSYFANRTDLIISQLDRRLQIPLKVL